MKNQSLYLCLVVVLTYGVCHVGANSNPLLTIATTLTSISVVGVAVGYVWFTSQYAPPYLPEINSLLDKTIVITGATTGLGLDSAKRLAVGGANVVLTARSDTKGRIAVEQVQQYLLERNIKYDTQRIIYKIIDLDDLKSVRYNVEHYWDDVPTVDVLLNNAGVMALPHRELTIDGYERQMQSNHLGHFLLTALLFPKLSSNARIINVSSLAHRRSPDGLPFHKLWQPQPEEYDPFSVYSATKLANILFTQELQRRIIAASDDNKNISVLAIHPGVVLTDLGRYFFHSDLTKGYGKVIDLLFDFLVRIKLFKTTEMGSATQVWASAIPTISSDMKGKYFVDCKESPILVPTDLVQAKQLWDESEEKAHIKFNI